MALLQLLTKSFSVTSREKGQTLVELLLAIGMMAIILPALYGGFFASRQGKAQQGEHLQAAALLAEEEEAMRSVREKGWANIATNGTYHATLSGSIWSLSSGSETVNRYTRQVTISDAYRNQNGDLAGSGTVDPSTKKLVYTVSWGTPYTTSISATSYLTRYVTNLAKTQTTVSDFSQGTLTSTVIDDVSGGEVKLGAGGGGGNWCNPKLSITTVDLSRQGVPTAISAYPGTIVTGTGGNASGPTFVRTSVSSDNPPTATFSGQFNNSKSNGVFTENNYGYIATTNNSQEIQILDLSSVTIPPGANTTFTQIGSFNAPGNGQGNSVFVSGTVGYMTDGSNFYTFDLTSHAGSRSQLNTSTVTLAGTGNKVVVVGNYAYVATNSTTTQLQVINVSDPVHPSIVASFAAGNSQSGIDVSVNATGTRAYLVTGYASSSLPDLFIIDTSTKSGSLPKIGTGYNTGGMIPTAVAVATGNRVIIGGTGGTYQYQVVNIESETAPVICTYQGKTAGLQIPSGVFGVATVSDNGFAYSYITTGDANAELKMILGGAGGQFSSSGTFESDPFDALSQVVFNGFHASVTNPSQTTIKLQVAVANPVSGSCTNASYSYKGPNGDGNQYFSPGSDPSVIQGPVPILSSSPYFNPGECFRYKVLFNTSDVTQSPVLYDMSVNYSL